jgi:hypothetical protein
LVQHEDREDVAENHADKNQADAPQHEQTARARPEECGGSRFECRRWSRRNHQCSLDPDMASDHARVRRTKQLHCLRCDSELRS